MCMNLKLFYVFFVFIFALIGNPFKMIFSLYGRSRIYRSGDYTELKVHC